MTLNSVAIVIPNLNGRKYLRESVQSALANNPGMVVICDNGSDEDNSVELANDYVDTYSNVFLVEEPHRGTGWAKNSGVSCALEEGAEFIIILDSDNWLEPEYAQMCMNALEDDVAVVCPGLFNETGSGIAKPQMPDGPITVERLLLHNRAFCSSLYRSECWSVLGGYDCRKDFFYDDWDFWIRAAAVGFNFEVLPKPLLHHRIHPDQITTRLRHKDLYQRQYLRAKHADLFALYGIK